MDMKSLTKQNKWGLYAMQVWTILVDYTKDDGSDELIFEDRLFFVGLNKEAIINQFISIIKDPDRVLCQNLMLDYDSFSFLEPRPVWDSDDCLLKVRLTRQSVRGDIDTNLYFRLILLDLKESCTLQTSIPEETIGKFREIIAGNFLDGNRK